MPNELKPCPFCHEDSDGYTTMVGAFYLHKSPIYGWCLNAGKCKPRPIKYCPICGRNLEQEG